MRVILSFILFVLNAQQQQHGLRVREIMVKITRESEVSKRKVENQNDSIDMPIYAYAAFNMLEMKMAALGNAQP